MSFSTFVITNNLSNRLDAGYYSPDDIFKEQQIKQIPYDILGNKIKKMSSGATPKGATYLHEGVSFIRTQNVRNNLIEDEEIVFISEEDNATLKRSQLEEEDVLLTITGVDLGHSAVVQKRLLPANINQHSVKMETNEIDPYFLSVFLNSKYGQSQIWRRVYGATRPAINYDEIKDIIVPLPSINIQQYIGNKVRKAERLREEAQRMQKNLNDEIEKVLGKIPAELFNEKKWGEPSSESLIDRLDPNYYQYFYLKIEELIKQTGHFSLLSNVCEVISQGFNKTAFRSNGSISAIGIGDFGLISPISNEEKMISCSENQKLQVFDIVWCNTAHLSKYIGEKINMILENDKFSPTAEVTYIRPNIEKINPYFLFSFFNTEWGYFQIQRTIRGMVSRSYADDVKNILVPLIKLNEEQEVIFQDGVEKVFQYNMESEILISEAKNDVESLIDGTFNELKITETE